MLTVVDAANVPITTVNVLNSSQTIIPGAITQIIVPPTSLPSWMTLGNATAYVSVFNNWPPNQYFPICPETSKHFTVVKNIPQDKVSSSVTGNYGMAFNLSYVQALPFIPWGNYTVEVSATIDNLQAIDSYVFWVKIPGEVVGDGVVNAKDLMVIAYNWEKTIPPAPAYASLDGRNKVDATDLMYVAFYWLRHEQKLP
jgi:hypothetical protein